MPGDFWFFLGLVMVVGTFVGLVKLIQKRQDDPKRCYPNQDEQFPWGV